MARRTFIHGSIYSISGTGGGSAPPRTQIGMTYVYDYVCEVGMVCSMYVCITLVIAPPFLFVYAIR